MKKIAWLAFSMSLSASLLAADNIQYIYPKGYRIGAGTDIRDKSVELEKRIVPNETGHVYADPTYEVRGMNKNKFTFRPQSGEKVIGWHDYARQEHAGYTGGADYSGSANQVTIAYDETRDSGKTLGEHYLVVDFDYIRYHLSYDDNGGNFQTVPSRNEYIYTNEFTLAETGASRDGYDFGGWTNAAGMAFQNLQSVTGADFGITNHDDKAEVILYANWIPHEVTLSYDLAGATAGGDMPEKAAFDEPFALPAPRRTGYSFCGWSVTNGLEKASGFAMYSPSEDAGWAAIAHPGQLCMGWTDRSEVWFKNLNREPTNVVMLANMTQNVYKVTFKNGGGQGGAEERWIAYDTPEKDIGLNGPTFTGHDFLGYWTGEHGSGEQIWDNLCRLQGRTVWDIPSNITVYANWSALEYKVRYDLNGGEGATPGELAFNYDADEITLSDGAGIARKPYELRGWSVEKREPSSDTSDFELGWKGSASQFLGSVPSEARTAREVTLYAVWYDPTVNVTLEPGAHGSLFEGQKTFRAVIGEPYGSLPNPTPDDSRWVFSGWYTAGSGGSRVTAETKVRDADHTLYGQWVPAAYCVAYDGNGATDPDAMPTEEFRFETPTNLAANVFVRTGHAFSGWATNLADAIAQKVTYVDRAEVVNLADVADVTNTLVAVWTTNSYTVAYDANGGSGEKMPESVYAYGTVWELPECSYREEPRGAYDFGGWSTNRAESGIVGSAGDAVSNLAAEDGAAVTLYAIWKLPSTELSDALDCAGTLNFRNDGADALWTVTTDEWVRNSDLAVTKYGEKTFNAVRGACLINTNEKAVLTTYLSGKKTLRFNWMPYDESQELSIFTNMVTEAVWTGRLDPDKDEYNVWLEAAVDLDFPTSTPIYFTFAPSGGYNEEDLMYGLLDNVRWGDGGDEPTEEDRPTIDALERDGGKLTIGIGASDARFEYDLVTSEVLTAPEDEWTAVEESTKAGTGGKLGFEVQVGADPARFFKVRVKAKGK